jgi:hypothetical protein
VKKHIVAFKTLKAPFFAAVGAMNIRNTAGVVVITPRQDGSGYDVEDLRIDTSTKQILETYRIKTGLTLQAAKKLHAEWLKEGKAKAKLKNTRPAPAIAEPFATPPHEIIDPTDPKLIAGLSNRQNLEEVREKFLRSKWPRTFKAMDEKSKSEIIEKAYLLDVVEFSGIQTISASDPQAIKEVAAALYNYARRTKKKSTMLIQEAIAFHWPKLVYLDNKGFAAALKDLTGITMTPAAAKKHRVRLGLFSRCPAGRRSSPQ